MEINSILIQLLNGIQYGLLLFLVAAGLTLVFGIMGVINLAHGSFYMIGAYLAWSLAELAGSFWVGIAIGIVLTIILGMVLEVVFFKHLYRRDHLYQVLMTYGLILIFEDLRSVLWGNDIHGVVIPELLNSSIQLTENLTYPMYRFFVSAVCIAIAIGLYLTIQRTRLGMIIRAGATNSEMTQVLGVNIKLIHAVVFSIGVSLAAIAGMVASPISSAYPNMGTQVLITCFVIVVIGGIGSVWGALAGALLIGLADTFGNVFAPEYSGLSVFILMSIILIWRPEGLFKRSYK
ncbi:MAG: branched-chain amino acid ABC transporter permease [Rhodocyclaceae bacterium]|nr:MAG: branched-chain amino acid ABC transporter permease [Rhodocyclaceae bacterium]